MINDILICTNLCQISTKASEKGKKDVKDVE